MRRATLAALSLAWIACGSTKGAPQPQRVDDSVCAALFDGYAAYLTRCPSPGDLQIAGLGFTGGGAADGFDQGQRAAFIAFYCDGASTAPGASRLGAEMAACTTALGAGAPCGRTLGAACAIAGSLSTGQPCVSDVQCESGRCSTHGRSGAACGVCEALVEQGGDCSLGQVCGAGLRCGPGQIDDAGVFAAPCLPADLKEGDFCADPTQCVAPLACVAGYCVIASALSAEGQACGTGCGLGLSCSTGGSVVSVDAGTTAAPTPAPGVCIKPTPVTEGQGCASCDGCGRCAAGLACFGVCNKAPVVGLPCEVGGNAFDVCSPMLACVGGKCQVPDFAACAAGAGRD